MKRILAIVLTLGICASSTPRSASAAAPEAVAALPVVEINDGNQRVMAGDIVQINIIPGEEYSREVNVQPDGAIQMPLLGSLQVAGLTLVQLQRLLERRYSKFIDSPQITCSIKRFGGRRVAILGEISKPGFYEYRDGMRILELVSVAGGFTLDARTRSVRILRNGPKASVKLNFEDVLHGNLAKDTQLNPGDTVYIPKKTFTEGATWVNRNILPWALVTSMVASIVIATRGRR